jgi:SPOR domain
MPPVDGHDDRPGSPPWVWAALVAVALATLTAGAIVGMVTTDDRDGSTAASSTDAAAEPAASVPTIPTDVLPPTVPIPPVTEVPTDTGFTIPTVPDTTTVPGASTVPSSAGTWPAGQPGYTVILASVAEAQGRAEADSAAQRATAAGLPQVGVLRSSEFPSLRPGWWVVYSGVYGTDAEARAALPQAQAAGFPSAYPRRVAP